MKCAFIREKRSNVGVYRCCEVARKCPLNCPLKRPLVAVYYLLWVKNGLFCTLFSCKMVIIKGKSGQKLTHNMSPRCPLLAFKVQK